MNKQHSPLRTILSSRKTRFLLFALFIFCLVFGQQILVAFSQSTIYKRTITIENNLGNQTDYEFELLLDTRPLVTAGKLTPDCFNLKFIDDTNRELEYFLANGCNTDATRIWIRIPTLSAGSNQIHMIYGPEVTSALRQEWHGGQLIAPFDGECPADWQAVSGLNDEQRFARGSESFGLTGGSENHNHTYAGNTNYVESTFTLTNAPSYTHPQNHRHVMSGTTSDVSHLPPYKDVIFCASYPGHIPNETGATSYIGFFETVPSEWNRSPSFDGRFLRGNNIAGGTGGTSSHTHIISGNTNQVNPNSSQEDTYVGSSNRGIGGVHRHAYSGVTNAIEHLPPYLDMLVAHPSTANQALPGGMVAYFTQLPPIGWESYSSLAGRFIRGSDVFGGIGGMDSHSHTLSGFTGYADGNPNDTRNGCCNHTSYDNHRHSYNLTSAPAAQLPPYLDVVPGRRQTSIANYVVGPETDDTATVFAVFPTSLLFPHTVETMSSQPLTVTITNDETVSLTINEVVLSGIDSVDFAVSSDNCSGQTIASGATCIFSVVFAPQSEGEKHANLNFVPANPLHFIPNVALHGISKDLQQIIIPITQNGSDARQASNNTVSVNHNVLFVNATWVALGLQFENVPLSPEAEIVSAHLELTAQRNDSGVASYTIAAQAADDAPPFQNSANNILAREQTTAVTEWSTIPAWTAGGVYNTPNIAPMVQEVIGRPGWVAGNGMAFILTGSGNRRFWSVEGNPAAPAQLVIDYAVDPPPSTPTPTTTLMATPIVTSTPSPFATSPPGSSGVIYAINAGGGAYMALNGTLYEADNYFVGGNTTNFPNPVSGTTDEALYQTERYGPLGNSIQYNFPVGSGTYDVLLQFSEGHFSNAGERVFDTVVEGSLVVDDLDLAGTVGKDVAYDVFVQNVAITDGNLDIDFHAVVENAKVSAIVIYDAGASPTTTPTVTLPPAVTSTTTATATPSPATATPAMGSCLVYYDNYDDWGTEFLADVYIVNLTNTPLAGYTLSWTFTGNQDITSSWSAAFSQSGQTVTASNPAAHWNGTIDANGGMVEIGFSAIYSGNNAVPVDFTLTSPAGSCQVTVIEGNPATPTSTPTPSQTPPTLQVTTLTLINAETDEDIGVINDGDTLNLATLPTQNLNVRADVVGPVDSVRFEFDTDPEYAWEGVAPYALAGDNNGDYNDWTPLPGPHTLGAIPYQQVNGEWIMGTGLLVTFTVVNDSTPTITPVPPTWTPTSTPAPTATATPTNTPTATATHTYTPTPTTIPTSTMTATVTPSVAGNGCQLFYDLDVWMGGYIAELYLVNLRSTPIEGYTLSWDFAGDDVVVDDWNATFVQNGQTVTASNPASHWNGVIPANGGEVKIGFEASYTGDIVQTPTNISLVTTSGICSLEIILGNPATPTATPPPATVTPSPSPTQTPQGIRVTSLTLINAETDEDIGVINDGDTLNLATLPTQNLNVRADVAGPVDSVRFEFDTDSEYAWEGVAPYALAGDNNGDYNDWTPLPGPHTLGAVPYQQINGEWMMGTRLQVTFTVINDPAAPTATVTPSTPTFTATATATSTPMPTSSTATATPTAIVTATVTPTLTPTATVTPLITRTWQIVSPTINLNTNSDYAFAYVPTGNHLVLYGGNANGWPYQDETWTFGGLDWTLNSVTERPTAVYGMRMAGDILFGGSDVQDDVLAETWSYDGTSWQLLTPTTSPPPRLHHSMAYDSENGRVYLFGGQNGTGYYNGTWVYENSNWTLLTTSNTPPPRSLHSLIYRNDQLWVFGGRAVDGTSHNDLWHLDLTTNEWTEITASGTIPTARMAHSMTYDRQQDRFLLFGGKPDASGTYLADTWLLDPTTLAWEEQIFAVSPPAIGYHTAPYDPLNNQIVLVTNNAQTWIYK